MENHYLSGLNAPGVRPIAERFFSQENYGALQFKEGFVFFRVAHRETLKFEPLAMIDENGTALTVAAQASSADITIRDPRSSNETVLGGTNMKNSRWRGLPQILHGSIGIKYPFSMFLRMPAKSGALLGSWPTTTAQIPTDGDFLGNVDGDDSPYHEPTDMAENVIVPGIDLSIQLFNHRSSATDEQADVERPVLALRYARYGIEILTPVKRGESVSADEKKSAMQRRANQIIRNCVYGKYSGIFRTIPVGFGESLVDFPHDVALRWGREDAPAKTLTWEEAILLQEV